MNTMNADGRVMRTETRIARWLVDGRILLCHFLVLHELGALLPEDFRLKFGFEGPVFGGRAVVFGKLAALFCNFRIVG